DLNRDDVAGQPPLEVLRCALPDDPALVDDEDPVAERVGLVQVVGGQEDGGVAGGASDFSRMVTESPALMAKMRQMGDLREEYLAQVLAEETDADPDDPTPRLVAAQLVAVTRAVSGEFLRRRVAGESLETVLPPVRAAADRAFDLVESGVGAYAVAQ
ncbi:MAG TPA: TetR family transcriptional regulator, partial [Actinoallomurus sp.]|nr:TetR family transcriptional regulator [Actinoallomurus sp.]